MNDLVEFIKRYALEHYERGGWDVIVECWDDNDIVYLLGNASTEAEALEAFSGVVSVWRDRQADARNSAF